MRLCDSTTRIAICLVTLLLLAACATQPKPQLAAPAWDAVPPPVLDGLCGRLRMDAIATGSPLAIVSTTRPLGTQASMSALSITARGRVKGNRIAPAALEANREMPLKVEGTSCTWRSIPAAQLDRFRDEMVVELSAPFLNPFAPRSAGLFARVTVGGEGASWYWISLVPYGDQWAVGQVIVLVH